MIELDTSRMFPRFILNDQSGYALAKAIEAALNYFLKAVQAGVDTVQDTGKMAEWRLDEMAWELGAEWYDYEADIDAKRAQIDGATEFYHRLGTPSAMLNALEAVYGAGQLEEWFEYGGEPYHFRLQVTDASAAEKNKEKLNKLVSIVKSLRSTLDGIYYSGAEGTAAFAAGAAVVGVSATAYAAAET